jgi:hypothetical protein
MRNFREFGSTDRECRLALDEWQAQIERLRHLVEHADEFTPSAFVKNVDESMPELRRAAMATVIAVQILNGEKGGI